MFNVAIVLVWFDLSRRLGEGDVIDWVRFGLSRRPGKCDSALSRFECLLVAVCIGLNVC